MRLSESSLGTRQPGRTKFARTIFHSLAALLILGGCGGGGGDGGSGPQSGTSGIEGVWEGSVSAAVYRCVLGICTRDHYDTAPGVALAAQDGTFHVMTSDVRFVLSGRANVRRNAVSGTLRKVCIPPGTGTIQLGHVSIEGSYAFQRSLDLNYDFDECFGDGVINLNFHSASRQAASLSDIEGTWSSSQTVITIDQDGQFLGSTSGGCQLSGNIAAGSQSVSIFRVDMLIENCADWDGRPSGLAAIVSDASGSRTFYLSVLGSNRIFATALSQ